MSFSVLPLIRYAVIQWEKSSISTMTGSWSLVMNFKSAITSCPILVRSVAETVIFRGEFLLSVHQSHRWITSWMRARDTPGSSFVRDQMRS